MAIGERIHFFRTVRGMTQKFLGMRIGFDEKTADVRIAQYETGTRTPKDNYTKLLADALGVLPQALTVPDIDSYEGLMHTLFTLEDVYGLTVSRLDGEICLHLKKFDNPAYPSLISHFEAWQEQADQLHEGRISKDAYDEWRYHFTIAKSSGIHAAVPSESLTASLLTDENDSSGI